MPRKKKLWRVTVGGYGYSVTACQRNGSPHLYLSYRAGKKKVWRSLGHDDRVAAESEARKLAALHLSQSRAQATGVITTTTLFAEYQSNRSAVKARPGSDKSCLDLWLAFLKDMDASKINRDHLDAFVKQRRAGMGKRKAVKNKTILEDVSLLKTVLTWAVETGRIVVNPVAGYTLPKVTNRRRPIASEDRFEALMKKADKVNPRFPYLLSLVNAMGWRVSALCSLRASDLDFRKTNAAPHGLLFKRGEYDKMGVEHWVPLNHEARTALDGLLSRWPAVGDVWLFPAVRSKKKPWTRYYARDLLNTVEEAAGLDSRGFHSFRRKWATERKHLPRADVAAAGGWTSVRTLDIYQQVDDETMYAVVSEPRKLREVGAQKGA